MTGLLRQPGGVSLCVIPTHTDDGIVIELLKAGLAPTGAEAFVPILPVVNKAAIRIVAHKSGRIDKRGKLCPGDGIFSHGKVMTNRYRMLCFVAISPLL